MGRSHVCAGVLPTKGKPMPLYFFDSGNEECLLRGDAGVELPGVREARDEAVRLLPSIAHDMGLASDRQDIVSIVRDERNQAIFKATLSLKAEWLIPCPGSMDAPHGPAAGSEPAAPGSAPPATATRALC